MDIRLEKETPTRGLGPLLFIFQGCIKVGKALGSDRLGSRQAAGDQVATVGFLSW